MTPELEAECLEDIAQLFRRLLNRIAPACRTSKTPDLVAEEVETVQKIISIAHLGIAAPLITHGTLDRILDICKFWDDYGISDELAAAMKAEGVALPSADILPFPPKPK